MHVSTVHGKVNLQATLAATAPSCDSPLAHHPLICTGRLSYYSDGRFQCDHALAPADDERSKHAVQTSIALLLMEIAHQRYGATNIE